MEQGEGEASSAAATTKEHSEEEEEEEEEEDDEPEPTRTSIEQEMCESACAAHLKSIAELTKRELEGLVQAGFLNEAMEVCLLRDKHAAYAMSGLRHLPGGFICLDASRPWLTYWMLHSLDLLVGLEPTPTHAQLLRNTQETLSRCQDGVNGGFGGGPQQLSHCAPTYAAVLALLVVGTQSAYDVINRPLLYRWFLSLKTDSGGFRMHHDGEVDVRGTYTVMAVASLLNMLTPHLADGVAEYLLSCQTYEGGFGGEPGNEAHGGYAFCAFAALMLLGRAQDADVDALQSWLVSRQLPLEGGFQGRTNKLVDGCYSFWQGGTCALLEVLSSGKEWEAVGWTHGPGHQDRRPYIQTHPEHEMVAADGDDEGEGVSYDNVCIITSEPTAGDLCFNQHALQRYVLHCAQALDHGGLRDKPGKHRDFYHTCYCLSGLSVAQWGCYFSSPKRPLVYGDMANLLAVTSPIYNIRDDKVERAIAHFSSLPHSTHEQLLAAAAAASSS